MTAEQAGVREDIDDDSMPTQILLDPDPDPDSDPVPEAEGLAHWLATRSTRTQDDNPGAGQPMSARARAVAGGVCAVAVVAAVFAATTGHSRDTVSVEQTMTASASASATPTLAAPMVSGNSPGCVTTRGEAELTARVADGGAHAVTGDQAVAMFEAAYYRARDGGRARAVVAESAAVADAATIQAGIDSLPAGTTYCARIAMLAPGLYHVEIGESRPGEPETLWRQQISTSAIGGRMMITAITPV